MVNGYHSYTNNGNMRRASYSEVCKWIKESWDEVSVECIKNGFRKAEICDYEVNSCDESTDDECDEIIEALESFEVESDEDFDGFI